MSRASIAGIQRKIRTNIKRLEFDPAHLCRQPARVVKEGLLLINCSGSATNTNAAGLAPVLTKVRADNPCHN